MAGGSPIKFWEGAEQEECELEDELKKPGLHSCICTDNLGSVSYPFNFSVQVPSLYCAV